MRTFNQLLVTTRLELVTYRIDTEAETASQDCYSIANLTTILIILWGLQRLAGRVAEYLATQFFTIAFYLLRVAEYYLEGGEYARLVIQI